MIVSAFLSLGARNPSERSARLLSVDRARRLWPFHRPFYPCRVDRVLFSLLLSDSALVGLGLGRHDDGSHANLGLACPHPGLVRSPVCL